MSARIAAVDEPARSRQTAIVAGLTVGCFLTWFAHNLAAILFDVRTAAGPDVPIVGMTYYNVFLPLGDPVVNARINALNNLLASTFAAAGVSVADVAGAFSTAERVCAWTWFCTHFDTHPNATGYGVIADAFLDVIQP